MPTNQRYVASFSFALIAILAAGCRDQATAPTGSSAGTTPRSYSLQAAPGPITEVPVDRRFDISVTATGSFTPNAPIQLTARATAKFATNGATVSVRLPDVQLASAKSGRSDTIPVGVHIPPLASTHTAFGAMGTATATGSALIAQPGIYRVVASVVSDSTEPATLNGRYVQNIAYQTIWIVIDANGGRALDHYDPSVIPPGMNDDHPGPWRPKGAAKSSQTKSNPRPLFAALERGSGTPSAPSTALTLTLLKSIQLCTCDDCPNDPGCNPPPPPPPPPPPSYLPVQLFYYNNDDQASETLNGISYQVWSGGTLVQSGTTDQTGSFTVVCPVGSYEIKASAEVPGKANEQDFHGNVWQLFDYITAANPCSPVPKLQLFTTLTDQSWVITQARITVDSSRAFFQISRSEIVFEFNRDQGDNNSDYYDPSDDHINLYYIYLYGAFGRFSTSHEYGHALAQQSLQGARGGYCPSPHYLNGYDNLQCALSEGWADYHSVAIRGTDDGAVYNNIASNGYYTVGQDGSISEGAVAAFLFDVSARSGISDPYNGHDLALHYAGNFVAHMMDQCVMTPSFGNARYPDGVDDMTYCLEDLIDPTVESTYFQTRSTYGRPQSGGYTIGPNFPSNWSQADVRRVWLHKLYGQ